jgi:hypothetical protein
VPVADGGGLDGVLPALAGDKRPPPRPVGPRPPDLGLGAVQAQPNPVAVGVGEHIRQGVQPHAGHVRDGEAALGQQRPDLVDRAGDGGAVHPVQHGQGLVGQLKAEDHQGNQDPVAEDQPVAGPAPTARWRGWPRRWYSAPSWAAVHGSASSVIRSPRCCRDSPVKQGWERAARAHAGVDTHA